MRYIYCPLCGAKLKEKECGDDGYVPFCINCDKLWFDTFSSCSIILVANECQEVALLKQSYISDKYMTLVAGYIVPGESAEETALREVKEELGIELDALEYAGTYWFSKNELLMHGFIGMVKKCDFKLSAEVDEAKWTPVEDVPKRIFPDSPGNAAYAVYKLYMDRLTSTSGEK